MRRLIAPPVLAVVCCLYFLCLGFVSLGHVMFHGLSIQQRTPTQIGSSILALWIIPAFGVLSVTTGPGEHPQRVLRALRWLGIAEGALIVTGLLATTLWPNYPQKGPHELLASAVLVPPLVVGSIALARVALVGTGLRVGAILAFCFLNVSAVHWARKEFGNRLRDQLPIHLSSEYWVEEDNDCMGFYDYAISAPCSPEEFHHYVELLQLVPAPEGNRRISMPDGWLPNTSASPVFVLDHTAPGPEGPVGCMTEATQVEGRVFARRGCW